MAYILEMYLILDHKRDIDWPLYVCMYLRDIVLFVEFRSHFTFDVDIIGLVEHIAREEPELDIQFVWSNDSNDRINVHHLIGLIAEIDHILSDSMD